LVQAGRALLDGGCSPPPPGAVRPWLRAETVSAQGPPTGRTTTSTAVGAPCVRTGNAWSLLNASRSPSVIRACTPYRRAGSIFDRS